MVAGALPFVIAVVGRAMFILVAAAVRVIIMSSFYPLLGSTILTSFPPWRLVFAASVTASSLFAFVSTYENSSLRDLGDLILWWWHIGLMAGSSYALLVSAISGVILVRW
jgi:hypothetical protein